MSHSSKNASMALVARSDDALNCRRNRTGSSIHRCELCVPVEPEPPLTNLRASRELGMFVLEPGELVKLRVCTAREFSRAVNLAKWSPQRFDDCADVTAACDTALELIRADSTLGNYDP